MSIQSTPKDPPIKRSAEPVPERPRLRLSIDSASVQEVTQDPLPMHRDRQSAARYPCKVRLGRARSVDSSLRAKIQGRSRVGMRMDGGARTTSPAELKLVSTLRRATLHSSVGWWRAWRRTSIKGSAGYKLQTVRLVTRIIFDA